MSLNYSEILIYKARSFEIKWRSKYFPILKNLEGMESHRVVNGIFFRELGSKSHISFYHILLSNKRFRGGL